MSRRTEHDDRVNLLASVPLLGKLSSESLQSLAQQVTRKQFQHGDMVFSEGQGCDGLCIIESGLVQLFKVDKDGREQVLATHGPGETLSELPIIDGGKHPCSAVALVSSTLLFIDKRTLAALCPHDPHCSEQLLSIVAARLRNALGLIEELSFASVRARLAAYLLRTATAGLYQNDSVTLPVNHEIAAHIGTVREMVSRHLGQLQTKGVIRITGRRLSILDWNALAHQAAGVPGRGRRRSKSLKSKRLLPQKEEHDREPARQCCSRPELRSFRSSS